MKKHQVSKIILIILAGIALLIWSRLIFTSASGSDITIHFLDVGQGDAILITMPGDEQVLIDGGQGDAVLSQVSKFMSPFDRKIEHVVLTHPHADHVDGLVKIAERYEIGEVLENSFNYDSAVYVRWQDTIKNKNIPAREVRQGDEFVWGSVKFEVLWPSETSSSASGDTNINNASVVGRFVFGESGVMLTGDAEEGVLSQLCNLDASRLQSDVLKAAHHGSENGAAACFLERVDPETVVISVGRDNKYGHPHAAALDLYSKYAYEILRTDEEGTVTCSINETEISCN